MSKLDENYIVQKSIPLLEELRKSKLTTTELKLIEVYLSKINSHDMQSREVVFPKFELDRLFGVNVKVSILDSALQKLMTLNVSDIVSIGEKTTKTTVSLFEEMMIEHDSNGIQQVKLKCSESAMYYFFNIEHLRYLRYKLRNTIHLEKKYSFALFMYLLENKFKDKWIVSLSELMKIINSPYDDYSTFNKLILKPCQKEIHEKTALEFEYSNIRRGQLHDTKEILFTVLSWGELSKIAEEQAKIEDEQRQIVNITTIPQVDTFSNYSAIDSDEPQEEEIPEHISFLCESVDNSFTVLEMKLILATISNMDIPPSQFGREIAQFDYLHKKYLQLQITEQQTTIKNRFGYFLKMIENDAESR